MELDVMNSESPATVPAAAALAPLSGSLFGGRLPVRFEFWDGSAPGPRDGPGTIFVRSPAAVRRMLWAPGELGLGRAYVTGELETEGDVIGVLRALHEAGPPDMKTGARMPLLALRAAARLGVAGRYGASVVGVTLSSAQADLARLRVKEAGLEEQIEIRVQDYGDVRGECFDAISSVGMFEHVGAEKMAAYFSTLHALLADTGRLLNHAISGIGGSRMPRRSFIGRFVFPDGELIDVSQVLGAMERAGFEVRDVESLREHYARTLRAWVANLESNWEEAVGEAGPERARLASLYGGVGQRL